MVYDHHLDGETETIYFDGQNHKIGKSVNKIATEHNRLLKKIRKSERAAKSKSRSEAVMDFGPRLEFNLHLDSRKRLLKIAERLGAKGTHSRDRGNGKTYRKAACDLINIYYIDNIYEPLSPNAKGLKKLYKEYFDVTVNAKVVTQENIKKFIISASSNYPQPSLLNEEIVHFSENTWDDSELEYLSNYRWLINTMEMLDRAYLDC